MPQDDPLQRRPDISEAKRALDWEPVTPLAEGLVKTIAYFEDMLKDNAVREKLVQNRRSA